MIYIYSEYHDAFFAVNGVLRNIVKSNEVLRSIIEKYIPEEDIRDVEIVDERVFDGIFVIEVLVKLANGMTYMILVDSPIPLGLEQWQRIVRELKE